MDDNAPAPTIILPEHLDKIYERRLRYVDEAHGRATAYDTAITVAGYGAFFALWSGVADDVSITARTATVALMGISLLLYIGWTIAAMLTRHRFDRDFAAVVQKRLPLLDEINEWDKIELQKQKGVISFMRWWPLVFRTAVLTGFGGALVLIGDSVRVALS